MLETVRVCGAGALLFIAWVNNRDAGEAASVAAGVMFNVTGMVMGLSATFGVVAVIVIIPL